MPLSTCSVLPGRCCRRRPPPPQSRIAFRHATSSMFVHRRWLKMQDAFGTHWGTYPSTSNNNFYQFTLEPHEVYNSQLYLVHYCPLLWKRVKSTTTGVRSRLQGTKIVSAGPAAELTTLPFTPTRPGRGYPSSYFT